MVSFRTPLIVSLAVFATMLSTQAPSAFAAIVYVNGVATITSDPTPFNPFSVTNTNTNVNAVTSAPVTVTVPAHAASTGNVNTNVNIAPAPATQIVHTVQNVQSVQQIQYAKPSTKTVQYVQYAKPSTKTVYIKPEPRRTVYRQEPQRTVYKTVPVRQERRVVYEPVYQPVYVNRTVPVRQVQRVYTEYAVQHVRVLPRSGADTFTGDLESTAGSLQAMPVREQPSFLRVLLAAVMGAAGLAVLS